MKKGLYISLAAGLLLGGLVGVGSADESRWLEPKSIPRIELPVPEHEPDDRLIRAAILKVVVPCHPDVVVNDSRLFCGSIASPPAPAGEKEKEKKMNR